MGIERKTLFFAIAALVGTTSQAAASAGCSVEEIEKLPVEQQMKQYSLCADLMNKRIELLKKQKEMQRLLKSEKEGADNAASGQVQVVNLPSPSVSPSTEGEPVVTSVEGAGKELRATLYWPDGGTSQVAKGVTIKGYQILDITIDGVKVRKTKENGHTAKKGDVVFIPVGTAGTNIAPSAAPAPVPVMPPMSATGS